MNDYARNRMYRRDRDMRDMHRGRMEYRGEAEYDTRRGVKGTGRYGIGGSRYYGRRDRTSRPDMRRDYGYMDDHADDYADYDYGYDYADYDYADDKETRLTHEDIAEWKKAIKNKDGTVGAHFRDSELLDVARRMNLTFDKYTEDEFCMVANMLYSDLCGAFKTYVPAEKEVIAYSKAARDWLDDADANKTDWKKLATYYYCIVE